MKTRAKMIFSFALSFAVAGVGAATGFTTVYADAASNSVAKVGNSEYSTFGLAYTAWMETDGSTLTLLAPINDQPTVTVSGDKMLDLNGFTLDGKQNEADNTMAGPVLNIVGGTFTLRDGSAAKTGTITGGGSLRGGGILVSNATFNMEGGTIKGNMADMGGGIYAENSTLNIKGGAVTANSADYGAGIYIAGGTANFTGENGGLQLSGNTAATNGGGIYMRGDASVAVANFTKGVVTGNSAGKFGGGVSVWENATFNMSGSSDISQNTAPGGAGVSVRGTKLEQELLTGVFNMTGGTIADNIGGKSFGGGVKIGNGGVFNMTGGSVNGNFTALGGGGVSAEHGSKATFGGTAQVIDNTAKIEGATEEKKDNVFFTEGCTISIDDRFTGKLGFNSTGYIVVTHDYAGALTGLSADDDAYEVYLDREDVILRSLIPVMLSIAKSPSKTNYKVGETFDWSGMVVTVTYQDGRTVEVTDYEREELSVLDGSKTSAEITYTERNVTLKASVQFTINYGASAGTNGGASAGTSAGNLGWFIAVVVLSAAFVIALIFVGIFTDGFKGKRKSK